MGLLRLMLAVSVLFEHFHGISLFGMKFARGDLAVQCFYMISGFYMALVLNEKYIGAGSYKLFIQQRYLRLYPTYLVIFIFTLAVEFLIFHTTSSSHLPVAYWMKYGPLFSPFTWVALLGSNLSLVGLDFASMFAALDPSSGQMYLTSHVISEPVPGYAFNIVGPAWTLSLELAFYSVAPFLVRKPIVIQALVLLISFGVRLLCGHYLGLNHGSWTYRFIPFELALFLCGSIAYGVYRNHKHLLRSWTPFLPWIKWPFFIALAFYSRLPGNSDARYYFFACGVLLLLPLLFLSTKDNPIDRLLGELSYPLYLIHWSIIYLITPWIVFFPKFLEGIVYVGVAILGAATIYWFIERPMDDFRHRLFERERKN